MLPPIFDSMLALGFAIVFSFLIVLAAAIISFSLVYVFHLILA